MDQLINPILLYTMCALGAVGLCLALPRRGSSPQILGAGVAGLAALAVILGLTFKSPEHAPNIYFYIFSAVALGSALRVITHPKPVYAALYFILTIIASAGLYLIMSAEFVAFALIIVYAGAILITYLFVIMLASQAPAEGEDRNEEEYDTAAREPIAASFVGFLLLATLSTLAFRGTADISKTAAAVATLHNHPLSTNVTARETALLDDMPRRLRGELRKMGKAVSDTDEVSLSDDGLTLTIKPASGATQTVTLEKPLMPKNTESVGFDLLRANPGSIEIAGVILLMAMLGAVVLSRKQVELEEEHKARQARMLAGQEAGE